MAEKIHYLHTNAVAKHKAGKIEEAISLYLAAIEVDENQPDWIYGNVIILLSQVGRLDEGLKLGEKAEKIHPESDKIHRSIALLLSTHQENLFTFPEKREVHPDIEDCVDINISRVRRQLIDSAIIEKYQTILSQMLLDINDGVKKMDQEALIRCLAEIRTDIHYLKTKLLQPSPEIVDPQAKNGFDLDKIIALPKPVPIIIDLKERIVGSGWYEPEPHGRWSGPGTISSVVLPYPVAGNYKLEIVVKSEAELGLIETLKINVDNQLLDSKIIKTNNQKHLPLIIQGELSISRKHNQSFLAVDIILEKTLNPQGSSIEDQRLLGVCLETISIIPQ